MGTVLMAYMYRMRRLRRLRDRYGSESDSSISESEGEHGDTPDGTSSSEDTYSPMSFTSTENPNRAGLLTDPPGQGNLVFQSSGRAGSGNSQGSDRNHVAVTPPIHEHADTRVTSHGTVDTNPRSGTASESRIVGETTAQTVKLPPETSLIQRTGSDSQDETRPVIVVDPAVKTSPGDNQVKPSAQFTDTQVVAETSLVALKPCSLCSLLVPCSGTGQLELIYHTGSTPPTNCRLIFDIYQSLLLKSVRLHGTTLKVCAECEVSFSTPTELLKHMYDHAVMKAAPSQPRSNTCHTTESRATESHCYIPAAQPKSQADESITQLSRADEIHSHSQVHRRVTKVLRKSWPDSKAGKCNSQQQQGKERYLCEYCGGFYHDIQTHIAAIHKKLLPHKCPLCDKCFPSKGQLTLHAGKHKPYLCKICNKSIVQKYFFTQHMRAHRLGVKPFKCDQCDKSFMTKYYLKCHQMLHTGQKPFQCPLCAKGYMCKQHMEVHLKSHSGLRQHKCTVCSKEFHSIIQMKNHMRSHGVKPHKCEQCGKSFFTPYKLNRHRAVHWK